MLYGGPLAMIAIGYCIDNAFIVDWTERKWGLVRGGRCLVVCVLEGHASCPLLSFCPVVAMR